MDHRVARGGSRTRNRVTFDQWRTEWLGDTGRPALPNPRDHLRLVKSSSESQRHAVNAVAVLEAENRALRNRVVDLALSIQTLREQAQRTSD